MRTPVGVAIAPSSWAPPAYSFSPRDAVAGDSGPGQPDRTHACEQHRPVRAPARLQLANSGTSCCRDDQGKSWQPAALSVQRQALITQVVFATESVGMAVGHEGWILRTEDGGQSWREQAFDQQNGEPLMSAARLPSGRWIAVGAFGRSLRSDDDGKTWQRFRSQASRTST